MLGTALATQTVIAKPNPSIPDPYFGSENIHCQAELIINYSSAKAFKVTRASLALFFASRAAARKRPRS